MIPVILNLYLLRERDDTVPTRVILMFILGLVRKKYHVKISNVYTIFSTGNLCH